MYSLLSSIKSNLFKKKNEKMSGIANLLQSVGESTAGTLGNYLGYQIGDALGYNQKLRDDQFEQQERLTGLQYASNYNLMKSSFEEQKKMWDETNIGAQRAHLEAAGMNPALMYAKGGAGGTTGSGGASVGGGNASNETDLKNAQTQMSMAGLAMTKMLSEIDLNKSVANKNNADAQTTTESRNFIVEKLKQDGFGQWLDNLKTEWTMGDRENTVHYNKNLEKEGGVSTGSYFDSEISTAIAKAKAEEGNQAAQALLTNEKAKGYWQELLNATKNADSNEINAAANSLAKQWDTGEFTNWKTWVMLGQMAVDDIFKGIGVTNIKKIPKATETISSGPKGITKTITTHK